ncbi:winged helix-turn-helix transcriptional regulator [Rhodococcus sp. P1Y]|uniref:winged helix-turn-helix transcriptional regulator n=1 Tax=Rhodococcus sp. P1Y TaxID=1302308 RepID=UPI000EAE2137|nr:helix-turn-helix domain-containing protein [Rhodococcus sp. P1Y]AYJ48449.1 transcriptional regulator [Rhodococcus sp. P1Y]
MALGVDYEGQDCSMARALELIGERWTLLIVRNSLFGVRRFSDFQTHLEMSKAVLTQRLAGLVDAGLLQRMPHGGREEYVPTSAMEDLWPVVFALNQWGGRHVPSPGGARREFLHADCGSLLTGVGMCPSCRVVPGPREVSMRPGPGIGETARPNAVSKALRSPRRLLEPIR